MSIHILLVEDHPESARLMIEAMRDAKVEYTVHLVDDGESALKFLSGEAPYAGSPRPDMILLDLNLPGVNGREVLATIKSNPDLEAIPVVIVTGSDDPRDISDAY